MDLRWIMLGVPMTWGRAAIAVLILNEIRGLVVVYLLLKTLKVL